MRYHDNEVPLRRRSATGPLAIFGRGRVLSFVLMAVISLFSFLSNNREWIQPPSPSGQIDVAEQTGSPVQPHDTNLAMMTNNRADASTTPSHSGQQTPDNPVTYHGGVVEDHRVGRVRHVGNRLLQNMPGLPDNEIRFYVLRDPIKSASYRYADGTILVTTGLLNQATSDDELAVVLSRRITDVLYSAVDGSNHVQIQQLPAILVERAGYRPSQVIQASRNQPLPDHDATPGPNRLPGDPRQP